MKEAEGKLSAVDARSALPLENKALQVLQKAEEEYELQVSAGQQGAAVAVVAAARCSRSWPSIFEQELDKMASRYETANQAIAAGRATARSTSCSRS